MTGVNLFFILPKDVENREECDDEMQKAYELCGQHGSDVLVAEWLTEEQCAKKTGLTKTDVFVLQTFSGSLFNKLIKTKALVVGARCLSCCLTEGSPIPSTPHPVYTIAMRGLTITCSGQTRTEKEQLKTKVLWMGGQFNATLTSDTTHLICNSVTSDKYHNSVAADIPQMKAEWVGAVWNTSLERNVSGSDPEFSCYRVPVFYNLVISSSGLARDKKKLTDLVNNNGGTWKADLQIGATDVLILKKNRIGSDKYVAAVEDKIPCVLPEWIVASVEKGHALRFDNYTVVQDMKTSSPNQTNLPDMSLNFSKISHVRRTCGSNFDETSYSSTTNDSTRMTTKLQLPTPVREPTVTGSQRRVRVCAAAKELAALVDNVDMKEVKMAGPFLDGCCIFVYGFTITRRDKLHRVISRAGAVRYDMPHEAVTHALCGDPTCEPPDRSAMPRATLLSARWLLDSMKQGRPLPENQYLVAGNDKLDTDNTIKAVTAASPMSQRNLQLLQQPRRPPVPVFNLEEPKAEEDDIIQQYLSQNPLLESEDTLAEYVKLGGASVNETSTLGGNSTKAGASEANSTTVQNILMKSEGTQVGLKIGCDDTTMVQVDDDSMEATEELIDIFNGIKFELQGLDETTYVGVAESIEAVGGSVLEVGTGGDYIVVPLDYDEKDVVSSNDEAHIVTTFWLDECRVQEGIVDVEYYHRPVLVPPDSAPLVGLTLCISTYAGVERTFIDELAQLLGAITQLTLCRRAAGNQKASTHLICPEASGAKYTGALKWGLPAVTSQWLLECTAIGRRAREGPFLVGDSKEPVWNFKEEAVSKTESGICNKENNKMQNTTKPEVSPEKKPKVSSTSCNSTPIQDAANGGSAQNTPKRKSKLSLGCSSELSPASRYIAMARQGLLGCDSQETPKRQHEDIVEISKPNQSMSTPPMENALSTPNLALFSPQTRRRLQAIKRGEMPSNPLRTPHNPFETSVDTPDSDFGAALRPTTGYMSADSRKRLWKFCEDLPAPTAKADKKETPICELKDRFFSKYNSGDLGTTPVTRKLHTSDADDTPPLKQRKLIGGQTPTDVESPTMKNLSSTLSVLPTQRCKIAEITNSQCYDDLRDDPHHEKAAAVKVPSVESQKDTVGWDDVQASEEKAKAPKYVFLISQTVCNRSDFEAIILRLGGSVVEEPQANVTHVLCSRPTRSERVLRSIAAGLWMLHPSYVLRCQEASTFINEEQFEWGNPLAAGLPAMEGVEVRVGQAAYRHRCARLQGAPPPFHGVQVMLHTQPGRRGALARLLKAGGAQILDIDPPFSGDLKGIICVGEQDLKPLSPDDVQYLASKRVPFLPVIFISHMLLVGVPENPMEHSHPFYKKMIENLS